MTLEEELEAPRLRGRVGGVRAWRDGDEEHEGAEGGGDGGGNEGDGDDVSEDGENDRPSAWISERFWWPQAQSWTLRVIPLHRGLFTKP